MRAQTKFTFQIGYPAQHPQFEGAIVRAASRICGGCTTSTKTGWWCEDGDSHLETFSGKLEREHCFELELTCERHKAERAYSEVAEAIAQAALDWGVDTTWVHVSETQMIGRHFNVHQINRQAALAAE